MGVQWIDFILFLMLFLLFVGVIAVNRITTTHKVYLAFHFVMMLWPLGQFAVKLTDFPGVQLFFINLSFVAMGMLGPGWLFFVFFLTSKSAQLKGGRILLYITPAALCIAAAMWNPNRLFMAPVVDSYTDRDYGPLFWLLVLVQFAYFFVALLNMFHALKSVTSVNQRKQLATALIGMFVLTGLGLLDVFVNVLLVEWLPVVPGLLALGILLSDLCFVIAIYRFGMFDILSMAQRDIFEHMTTGVIVVDENGKVLEVNRGASPLVQVMKGETFEMEKFLAPLQVQGEVYEFLYRYNHHPHEKLQMEFSLQDSSGRHVSIQISPVLDSRKTLLGRIITFHDVSELRKLVVEMNRKNEALHERNLELITIQEELFRVNQKLEQMAVTDGLTGCFNRRYLMQQLEHEVLLNMRYQIPFAIFLFDIDHFKQINDKYGHLAGDEVLRSTAEIVRSMLRRTDILARYGGEEFTVYLPHTNREQAELLAERIMLAVGENQVEAGADKVGVTISMGVLSESSENLKFNDPKEYLREVFSSADSALYKAKNEGRNRVVMAR
ncbi:PAS domain S-box-containing protein/diguanylate cyclase (GGDEF)-like protein [Cohnella sp. SGD-V74]|uniref:histidine kinase N-terminal 7TM domain-containing diguanylate cyclase n=1 Tax=unclassified Cohnella TaxID=2636738 RepID=UPI000D4E4393|nr:MULTISPECIES: diguanylate cyclase [unclassified Cohnella]PRX58011.1 PAS domain S-box-containing protein/diguanylate cyclase (GGDEF)-like protein [Cohnella sp. SGD-V74]